MITKFLSHIPAGLRDIRSCSRTRCGFLWITIPMLIPLLFLLGAIPGIRDRLVRRRNTPLEQATLSIPVESPPPPDLELLRRRELARRTNKRKHPKARLLYDPINDDPVYAWAINEAARRAKDEVSPPYVLGTCHLIWRRQKHILKEEFGIDWYSPREMNPRVIFD